MDFLSFFYRSKKRKAFFLGLLLCAGLLLFLSGRLWEIDVEGNVRNSTPEILDFLEQKGIRHGMAKEGSAAVRLQLRSVKISGYYVGISKTGGNQTAPYSQRRDIYTDYRRKGQICL